jgi:hypothetical protein
VELRLFTCTELEGTAYAEFQPGGFYIDRHWSENSVYLDWEAFLVVDSLVAQFIPGGPVTLSGTWLLNCIEALSAAATRVSNAASPEELFDGSSAIAVGMLSETEDWSQTRRDLSLLLRDLEVWMRKVHARKEPVTCLA